MALLAKAIIDGVARQSNHRCHSYHQRRRLPKLSLMPLFTKAINNADDIIYATTCESYHLCCHQRELSPWDVAARVASPTPCPPAAAYNI